MKFRLVQALFLCFLTAVFSVSALAGSRIYRDQQGVVQIYADSNRDLFFAFGYWIGHDRLFQVEMRKHQALGRRAEILGRTDQPKWANKFVEKDTDTRRFLDRDGLVQQINNLSPQDHEIFEAYAAGLNTAIDEALENDGAKLPAGFKKYGFRPEHWTVLDVVATATDVLAAYSSFASQDDDLPLYKFLAEKFPQHCDDILDQLIWPDDPYAISTMEDQRPLNVPSNPLPEKGCAATSGQLPNGLLALHGQQILAKKSSEPFEPRRASMAWAVGKDRADDANSIFLSGPQTGWHRPSYYYTVGLHGGDFDFIGMSAEGMPVFQVGFNRHYAWGMTAGLGMQGDFVELRLNEDGSAYHHNNQWVAFAVREEVIRVKEEGNTNEVMKNSQYGPVVSEDGNARIAYAKALSWRGREAASVAAWMRAAAAQSEDEWRHRAQSFAFNYNWFYADKAGKVGFAFTGRFPVRAPGVDVRLPMAGDGTRDYLGYTTGDETPIYLTEGALYNFNNRPTIGWPNSGLYWEQWSRGNQVEILKNAIDNWPDKVTWNELQNLNRTISDTDVNWHVLHDIFRQAAEGIDQNSPLRGAADAVLAWDGRRADDNNDGNFDAVGLTIFDAWHRHLVPLVLGPVFEGAKDTPAAGPAGYFLGYIRQAVPARIEEHPSGGTLAVYRAYLAAAGAPGIPNHYNLFQNRDPREVARRALEAAVAELEKKYNSPNVTAWLSPTIQQTFFPSNADRVPMTVIKNPTNMGVFANRGGVNLMVQYGQDGAIARAGFANPLGGAEDNDPENPSSYHLDIYAGNEFAPLYLVGESDLTTANPELLSTIQ